jgi:hypothetical protein
MAVGVQQAFSVTASSNGGADSNINFAEAQTPASLNDSSRAFMAALKGFANQITGAKTTGGSGNAQTYTSDSVAAITSYAAGRGFVFKAGFTNTGAATLNVDGVGATAIRKGGAETALSANDIVAGGIYFVVYNGTYWILLNPETGVASYQPLDAMLTAFAALSWSSGNALVQVTAPDTVSLTLTPSVSSITASQGGGATTPSANFTNATDSASVQVARFQSDRATPANNDEGYVSFYLSNLSGTQTETGRIASNAFALTAGAESGSVDFSVISGGTLAKRFIVTSTTIRPNTNDGLSLGTASFSYSDGFWASGALHNFNNGNVILTHNNAQAVIEATTGKLVSGLKASTETSGTLTVASRNRVVNCSGGITLDDGVFATDDWIIFDPGTSARTFTRASGLTMYVNGTDSASATLSANQMGSAYWRSATVVVLAGEFT